MRVHVSLTSKTDVEEMIFQASEFNNLKSK